MTSLVKILETLSGLGVKLWEDGGKLAYSAPKGTLTPALVQDLRAHKEEILASLRGVRTGSAYPPLSPRSEGANAVLPLSFAQQSLWFLDQLGSGSAYNLPGAFRIRGLFSVVALEQSLTEIVRRHESLRTVFIMEEGRAQQVIKAPAPVLVPVHDLQSLPEQDQAESLHRLAAAEASYHFDLSQDLLLRTALARLSPDEHVFFVTLHHIVADGWSIGVFYRELSVLYTERLLGKPSPLPPLAVQYADYTLWQRGWLGGELLGRQMAWWKEHLAGAPALLTLPTDRPRPPVQSYRGSSVALRVDAELTEALRALSRRVGGTLYTTLLAAFDVLLARHSRQEDIVVGVPIAGRTEPALEPLIGMFNNTLAVRVDLSGNPTFLELISRVRSVVHEAYEHQDVPFKEVVTALQLERSIAHSPLYQVTLVLQNTPSSDFTLEGAEVRTARFDIETTRFDLVMDLTEQDGGLTGVCTYNTDLFEASTIERLNGHLQVLLAQIAVDPTQRIEEIPILTEAERRLILASWNDTALEIGAERCIHHLFEDQAARTPAATAVVFDAEGETHALTYRALNERANQLAHHLRSLGVGPEIRVALCVERSLEMVVGLLGILKAGGAYVPVDPSYPKARVAFLLEDTKASVLITQERLLTTLPEHAARVICVDTSRETFAQERTDNPVSAAGPDNLAYVIYTSGSTGNPKGVQVNHRNVARLFSSSQPFFHFDTTDVWTLFHSYAFDFSVWELWGALLHGGRLVVVPFLVSRSPELFHQLLRRERVTVLNQTPSAFRSLIAADSAADEPLGLALRLVIFGGEAVDLQSLAPWFQRHGDSHPRLVNMYGITETTVHVTYRPLNASDLHGASSSPIGRPLPDLRVYVLDAHQQLLPIGVPGELYVGGAGVARGYLHRPELTAERFLQDPFRPEPGARLYKTGDLGRWLPSGELEHLGRGDQQVKIRGFRIELGEIESVLHQCPGVREAVVVAHVDASQHKRLVAYYTLQAGAEVEPLELRQRLAKVLPEYMAPSLFVVLERLPLTSSGKVDRRALPEPASAAERIVEPLEKPVSPNEKALAAIFCEVLHLPEVGAHERFFDLGGDSISSVQVVARARQVGLELKLQEVFQHPTVHALARIASVPSGAPVQTAPFSLIKKGDRDRLPGEVEDAYPPAAVQVAMLFFSGLDASAHVYHSVSSHHLRTPFDEAAWRKAAQAIIARHPVLRSAFDLSHFSEPLLLVHRHVEPFLRVHDWRAVSETEQSSAFSTWLAAEQKQPFHWSEPPLFRIHIHRTSEATCRLTLSLHHALLDGWSLALIVTELLQRYATLLRCEVPPWAALSSTYRDFIALERAALSDVSCQRYWDDLLADAPPSELPRFPPSFRERDRGPGFLNAPLPETLAAGIVGLATSAAISTKSILLAAHVFALSRVTGGVEVLTGLTAHGRPETLEAADIVGNFLNVLPLRAELGGGTWLDLCRAVLESEQRSLPFRHYPLAEMQKRAGRKQLFETTFNFVHFHVARRLDALDELDVLEVEDVAPGEMTLQANFAVDARTGRINFQLTYDPGALCRSQVEAIAGYYRRALEAIVAAPDGRYEVCSVLSPEERDKVLVAWNGPVTALGDRPFVHVQIARKAAEQPDVVAVRSADPAVPSLTYRELDERANRLAHHLRTRAIGPGSVLGMHVERSPEMIVGLLAALKSGAAYVPLDPLLPKDRLLVLLEQTNPDVILHRGSAPALPGGRRSISIDGEWSTIAQQPETDPKTPIAPSDLAYILFTSGSTGTPKGAQIDHGNLAAFMDSARGAYGIRSTDRVLQFATLAFDTSIEEIYLTLMQGGTLVLRDDLLVSSPERLITGCRELGLTALHFPTAYWHMLTAELMQKGLALPSSVRVVFIGGEAALPQRVHAWYRHFGDTPALVNTYGTTETTAVISIFTLGTWEEKHREGLSFPVGRPLPTVQAYVVDRHMQPVPTGTPGELFIGGPQVGPGYWRLPEMSVERYVPNPFGTGRIYRSGDLVRWLPDGTLECCGRLDYQVKIRGYRVEPGEVESVLSGHPDVRDAAVLVREERPGDRRLVAYAAGSERLSASALRRHLRQKLPEYSVPSEIVILDALPVTPNGKIDRRGLLERRAAPLLESANDEQAPAYAPPRDATEERLSAIFAEVLGRPRIGVHDDFFALGGDSLVAMQLSSRIRGAFAIDIPFRPILEHPSIAALAAHIEVLRPNETALTSIVRIPPDMRERELPVSYAQQRLWFLDKLGSGATYNMLGRLELRGRLSVPALERAIQEIVARHEVLRTTYHTTGEDVHQVITAAAKVPLPVVDLGHLSPEGRHAELAKIARGEAHQPFDLSRDIMLRTTLVRLSAEEHLLLFTVHHIASDAWSMNVFARELAALYDAFCAEDTAPLPPLPLQYVDFAAWQRGRDLGLQLDYWKQTLHKPLPVLELPLDFQPPSVQDYRGGQLTATLSPALTAAIRALAREEAATPFIVLLATFNLLFHRYTGLEDIILGTPSIGRGSPETEGMIGIFLNLLALRTDLSGNPPFRELVRRARQVTLDALAHQDAPFEKVVEIIQPDRRPGRDPIFEVMLNFVNAQGAAPQMSALTMSVPENTEPHALRALTLYVYELQDGFALELVYQRALFGAARMTCLLDQLIGLLEQIVADPDRTLRSYSLVTQATRPLLPDMCLALDAPEQEPITALLRAWAAKTPDSPAVTWAGQSFSYAELYQSAERIAHSLVAQGLRKGDVVAIHGARSFGTVASLFGVLLGGGVILPLADNLPLLRQQAMLRIGNTKLVVVVADVAPVDVQARFGPGWPIITVDARGGQPACAVEDARLPALPEVNGDDPAYIMFTSGTTGEPKGILGVHRGWAHFLAWQRATFGVGPSDRCAQHAGLSFDLMLRDVFLAPTSGATLCLPERGLELDGGGFLDWLVRERITLLHPVPSLAHAWLQHASPEFKCTSLRWTLFAGEPLTDALVRQWRRSFPESAVANFYGPAETTMTKCWHLVPAEPILGIQPIGRPLPEAQLLVMNSEDQLCGIGEPGQIVVRTPFRTLGYLNVAQNERRFVPNPERDDPDDLLYYSGDLGRYRPDGTIDILGRVDDETKIHGIRVQPLEIKAVLDHHPAISASAVIVTDGQDEKQLFAYVVPHKGQTLEVKELRHYLSQHLPAALVPSGFMVLEAIPVTTNGKVNRDALPPPTPMGAEPFAVPRNEPERQMVLLWQELLGLHAVGIHDNFFDLGGHSLVAVRLMARIHQVYRQQLPLTALFESPTVATLVERLEQAPGAATFSPLVPIQVRGERLPFFCAPGIGGNALYLHQLARALGPAQPFYGLQAVGLDGITPPHATIESMAAAYITAIKGVQPHGPYRLGGHSFGGQVAFEMAQQLCRAGDEVAFVALFDCAPPSALNEDRPERLDEASALSEMATILGFMAGRDMVLPAETLRPLPQEARMVRFKQAMEAAQLLPASTDMAHVRGWLSVFKSNYQMNYAPREVCPVRVVYFCARDQPADVRERRLRGWLQLTTMDIEPIEGSHLTIMAEPHIAGLAERLTQLLTIEPGCSV